VQAIRSRGQNPRLYVSFPLALAAAIGLDVILRVKTTHQVAGQNHPP